MVRLEIQGLLLVGALLAGCATSAPPSQPTSLRMAPATRAYAADTDALAPSVAGSGWSTTVDPATPFGTHAQDESAPDYRDSIRPYLWMAGLEGDIEIRGVDAEVDHSFGDILEQLDFGLMLGYEHRFDDWSLVIDSLYTQLGEDATVNGIEVDSTIILSYLEASAVLAPWECGLAPLFGARVWYAATDLEVGPFGTDSNADWVDPIVGARWDRALADRWKLRLLGDVGGFGIGSASKFSWHAQAVVGYELSARTTLGFGYRHLASERDSGGTHADLALSGFMIGTDYRF